MIIILIIQFIELSLFFNYFFPLNWFFLILKIYFISWSIIFNINLR